jgi:flagellar protein FliS
MTDSTPLTPGSGPIEARENADNSYKTNARSDSMFTPAYARASSAYKLVNAETSVQSANAHHLVHLLYEELLQNLANARGSIARNDIPGKGVAIGRAVRVLDEGLKAGLNLSQGGDLAKNLSNLYDYCCRQLTMANLKNDEALLVEVKNLIEPIASAWRDIAPQANQMGGRNA